MKNKNVTVDSLIKIVNAGGVIKTGIDIFSPNEQLLLDEDIPVNNVRILEIIKENGILSIPVNPNNSGGVWDKTGKMILNKVAEKKEKAKSSAISEIKAKMDKIVETGSGIQSKIDEIATLKLEALEKYNKAKENIKKVLSDIKKTGGKFDFESVEHTVTDLLDFLTENDNAFSYVAKEIFSYDDYLYSHSTNVCTIGSAVLNKFNTALLELTTKQKNSNTIKKNDTFTPYTYKEMQNIAIGYFLHDIGKVLIPDHILNKRGTFTEEEFAIVRTHSYEKSVKLLKMNKQSNPMILNIARYHHSALFQGERGCYPDDKKPKDIPPYVQICKLADIYDAMTSKRCYKNAFNPIGVVTNIFREYVGKNDILQLILRSFVKTIGICPPGSIVNLNNGQLAYVIDSAGPLLLPFTDSVGRTLLTKLDVIDLGEAGISKKLQIDDKQTIRNPADVYNILPGYLKDMIKIET